VGRRGGAADTPADAEQVVRDAALLVQQRADGGGLDEQRVPVGTEGLAQARGPQLEPRLVPAQRGRDPREVEAAEQQLRAQARGGEAGGQAEELAGDRVLDAIARALRLDQAHQRLLAVEGRRAEGVGDRQQPGELLEPRQRGAPPVHQRLRERARLELALRGQQLEVAAPVPARLGRPAHRAPLLLRAEQPAQVEAHLARARGARLGGGIVGGRQLEVLQREGAALREALQLRRTQRDQLEPPALQLARREVQRDRPQLQRRARVRDLAERVLAPEGAVVELDHVGVLVLHDHATLPVEDAPAVVRQRLEAAHQPRRLARPDLVLADLHLRHAREHDAEADQHQRDQGAEASQGDHPLPSIIAAP
jgi:hypothetical protein